MIIREQVTENDPVDGAPLAAEVPVVPVVPVVPLESFVHLGTGFQYTSEVLSLSAFPGL